MRVFVQKSKFFSVNSVKYPLKQNQKYKISLDIIGFKGKQSCAYLSAVILSVDRSEISRHIRWLTDFSGNPKNYTIVFTAKKPANEVMIAYRFNIDTPDTSDLDIEIPNNSLAHLEKTNDDAEDAFDEYQPSSLPSLTEEQESILEKRLIWVFGSARSGSTWLGVLLLSYYQNIIWSEPNLGRHLDAIGEPGFEKGPVETESYFFSNRHKKSWMPLLRKLILTRAFSHAQMLDKNIIAKDPGGSGATSVIMECLPNSKLIFLLRDGRDVVDSIVDAHKEGSWAKTTKPIKSQEDMLRIIENNSKEWVSFTNNVLAAYNNQKKDLRLLVKYEDLRKNTFSELKKIYDFLDLKISDEELQKIITIYSFENIPPEKKGPGKFFRIASPGNWKNSFSSKEKELMNSIMGKTLEKMNYEI